jgi:hypothetical protein
LDLKNQLYFVLPVLWVSALNLLQPTGANPLHQPQFFEIITSHFDSVLNTSRKATPPYIYSLLPTAYLCCAVVAAPVDTFSQPTRSGYQLDVRSHILQASFDFTGWGDWLKQ